MVESLNIQKLSIESILIAIVNFYLNINSSPLISLQNDLFIEINNKNGEYTPCHSYLYESLKGGDLEEKLEGTSQAKKIFLCLNFDNK